MKPASTAAALFISIVVVLGASYLFGTPPGAAEGAALRTLLLIMVAAWLVCFVLGEWTGNVSQVDRLWSLLPIVYAWVVAGYGGFSPRLLLMASLVTLWGARLTWNFSRHGGYRLKFWRGHEDYRWQVLRERPEFSSPRRWMLFNFGFISGYQNALILYMTLPGIVALQYNETPLGWLDAFAAGAMLVMIGFETIADNQQWRYQTAKYEAIRTGRPLDSDFARGFLDRGLWAYCRHPNYFAEQALWIAYYLFSVAASGQWINWSFGGCLLLLLLFQGSARFSEEISAGKYPQYRVYQRAVPQFLPLGSWRRGKS
jgi:steroid 5-alpha reductase family enzyme